MVQTTSSGLVVVYNVVLHAASSLQYLQLNTASDWVRLAAQEL